jgi:hypothetical protein
MLAVGADHTVEVLVRSADSLGVKLDAMLTVTGFQRMTSGAMHELQGSGMVKIGDRLLSVNGVTLDHSKSQRLQVAARELKMAAPPRLLRFLVPSSEEPRQAAAAKATAVADRADAADATADAAASSSVAAAAAVAELSAYLDVSEGADAAQHLPVVRASFGARAPCGKMLLQDVDPPDACSSLLNAAELAGALAVVQRGGCDFVQKVARRTVLVAASPRRQHSSVLTLAASTPVFSRACGAKGP